MNPEDVYSSYFIVYTRNIMLVSIQANIEMLLKSKLIRIEDVCLCVQCCNYVRSLAVN